MKQTVSDLYAPVEGFLARTDGQKGLGSRYVMDDANVPVCSLHNSSEDI